VWDKSILLLSTTPTKLPAPPLPPSEPKLLTEKNLTQLGEQHQITQQCERGNGIAQAAKQTTKSANKSPSQPTNHEVSHYKPRACLVIFIFSIKNR